MITQLHNVEVFSAERVSIEWQLSLPGDRDIGDTNLRITGRTDSGRVKLTSDGSILKIILRTHDVDPTRPPLELHEAMARFCGINDQSHVAILHWMLIEQDLNEIEDILQRRGVPNEIPEFDNLPHDPSSGDVLVFLGVNVKPLDIDGRDTAQRRFQGRRESFNHHQPSSSDDAVRSFIHKFNLANSFQNKIAQPWQEGEVRNMLSHICRLENMDPFLLLPQRNNLWTQRVRKVGGHVDDVVGVVFDENITSKRKIHPLRSTQTFPAVVNVTGDGQVSVNVSSTVKYLPDEELQFAGELHVSVEKFVKMQDSLSNRYHNSFLKS